MKTINMYPMRMQMCCCCCMHTRRNIQKRTKHIINIFKERQEHEEISIYHSIAFRAAS
mgnify:CR=1 FL=1